MVLDEPWLLRAFAQRTRSFTPICHTDRDDCETWAAFPSVNSRGLPPPSPAFVSVPRVIPELPSAPATTSSFSCAPEQQPYPMRRRLPPKEALEAVLSRLLANHVTIQHIRAAATGPSTARVQSIYSIGLAGGQQLVLATAPSSMVRLLRSEQLLVESEAIVIGWMRDTLTTDEFGMLDRGVGGSTEAARGHTRHGNYSGGTAAKGKRSTGTVPQDQSHASDFVRRSVYPQSELLSILPTLVASSITTTLALEDIIDSPYAIFRQPLPSGCFVTASSLYQIASSTSQDDALSVGSRTCIEFQAGVLVRQLSRMTAPTGRFGPAIAVLSPRIADGKSGPSGIGKTWSAAFQSMLEGVLRDAEDMTIHIPYAAIRAQAGRLALCLDAVVTTPRLVLVNAAEPSNLLVRMPPPPPGTQAPPQQKAAVVGLADWTNAFFGDPLFTRAFGNQPPSSSFVDGFRTGLDNGGGDAHDEVEEEDYDEEKTWSRSDLDTSDVRILLYSCYHLTVSIVEEFYRPSHGSSEREMGARRRLGEVLAKLAAVDVVGDETGLQLLQGSSSSGQRGRRPEGSVSSPGGLEWNAGQHMCRAELRG